MSKLILVAPTLSDEATVRALTMPTLLLWAEDDMVTWFSNAKVFTGAAPRLTLHSVESGGHRILDSYSQVIRDWFE